VADIQCVMILYASRISSIVLKGNMDRLRYGKQGKLFSASLLV